MSDTTHPPYQYVETPADLDALGAAMQGCDRIGIDTESDSMHSYFEKVCLVQIALPGDRYWVVDPLALDGLEPLRGPLEDPDVVKILHGADYDIVCMKRDFGFEMRGTFCTMTAGLLLGLEKIGLGDLVEKKFGVTLAKAFTRSDWSRRPLSDGQLEYVVQDVQFLHGLHDEMLGRLTEADLLEEAAIEFARLEERTPASRDFDPWNFLRIRGAKRLPERSRAVLRELVALRDTKARAIDRPPFKVVANDTLLRIAEERPRSAGRLRSLKGVTSYVMKRYGTDILAAVERGVESTDPVPDRAPAKPRPDAEARRMNMTAQKRHGRLKDWRKARAEADGTTTLAILPNPVMFELAKAPPETIEELAAHSGVGPHRAELYGEDILRILSGRRRKA